MKRFKPGVTFGDFVISDMKRGKSRIKEEGVRDYRRGWLVWLLVLVAFGVIGVRLAELQLFRGGMYGILADENRIKRIKISSPRGTIVDRNGTVLAKALEKKTVNDEGLEIDGWVRTYPLGPAGAHVIGYLGEVSGDEVGLLKEAGQKYTGGDWVGRMGLELRYEERIRGVDGGRLVEVDNMGKIARELGRKAPVNGAELRTSLDAGLIQAAWEAMGNKKGAVVVSIPKTGEILALVSSPTFDPNNFSTREFRNAEAIERVLKSSDLPMFDRSIGGLYPPGSTFKMITTAAAIESKKVEPSFTFNDQGVITVGEFRYTNWLFTKRGGIEGVVGFVKALTRSTDTFFYKVGELTGPIEIEKWAKRFGLGVVSGVDLPGEVEGLIATPEWKERVKGEPWYLGNTYHVAIGQGDILVTPLQINVMTNALANGGKKCRPYIVAEQANCEEIEIADDTLKIISQGMIGACSSGGTAFPLFDWNEGALAGQVRSTFTESMGGSPLPLVACKTGTAEYITMDGMARTHGWLTAFAPANDPVISVTVVVEGGGEGSDVAAPVVRRVMAKYFGIADRYPYGSIRGLGE